MRTAFKRRFKVIQTLYFSIDYCKFLGRGILPQSLLVGDFCIDVLQSVQFSGTACRILQLRYRILLLLQGCDFLCIKRNGLGVRSVGSFQFVLVVLDVVAKFLVTRGIGDKLLSAVFVLVPRFTTAVSAVC